MDTKQLNEELNAGFTALADLQAFTAVVIYQQLAVALGSDSAWAADRLQELGATVAREAPKSVKPQFLNAFYEKLGRYAEQVRGFEEETRPQFKLIEGGKGGSDGASEGT